MAGGHARTIPHKQKGLTLRYEYVLDVFVDGDKRTRFNVIVSPILDKMLYRLSRLGEVLHFIKHYQCLMLIERLICQRRQIGKERTIVV